MKLCFKGRKRSLEKVIISSIERKEPHLLQRLLYLLSISFKGIVLFRSYLYDNGWKKVQKGDLPIVCIGNITAGGTGKTPLVQKLAQDLKGDIKLAIISKGYRSIGVSGRDVISPIDRHHREVSAIYCGDEPFLLKKRLADIEVLLSKDRMLAIKAAKKKNIDLVLLDDGFQMRSLAKDLVVIVLHAKDLFGQGYYLPRGYLRDSPKRLKEADLLCITQNQLNAIPFENLCKMIRLYSLAPIIGAHIMPTGIKGVKCLDISSLKGKKVGVFCGIGKPNSYLETLEALKVEVVETLFMPDHKIPCEEELQHFACTCRDKGAEILLCTEKDFVKIVNPHYYLLPICYLETELNIIYGKDQYEAFKAKILVLAKKG